MGLPCGIFSVPKESNGQCSRVTLTTYVRAYMYHFYCFCLFVCLLVCVSVLLFDTGKVLKLCDFGTAKMLETTLTNAVGTVRYMAPEVVKSECHATLSSSFSLSLPLFFFLSLPLSLSYTHSLTHTHTHSHTI